MSVSTCVAEMRRIRSRAMDAVVSRAELARLREEADARRRGGAAASPPPEADCKLWEKLLENVGPPLAAFEMSYKNVRAYRSQATASSRVSNGIVTLVGASVAAVCLYMIVKRLEDYDAGDHRAIMGLVFAAGVCLGITRIVSLNMLISDERVETSLGESTRLVQVLRRVQDNLCDRPLVRYAIARGSGSRALDILANDIRDGKYTSGLAVDCEADRGVSITSGACAAVPFDPCTSRDLLPPLAQVLRGDAATKQAPYCASALYEIAVEIELVVDRIDAWDRPRLWKRISRQMALLAEAASSTRMDKAARAEAAAARLRDLLGAPRILEGVEAASGPEQVGAARAGCDACADAVWNKGGGGVAVGRGGDDDRCTVASKPPDAVVIVATGATKTTTTTTRIFTEAAEHTWVCRMTATPNLASAVAVNVSATTTTPSTVGARLAVELGVPRLTAELMASEALLKVGGNLVIMGGAAAVPDPVAFLEALEDRPAAGGGAWTCVRLTREQMLTYARRDPAAVLRTAALRPKIVAEVARFMPLDYLADVRPKLGSGMALEDDAMLAVFRDAAVFVGDQENVAVATSDVEGVKRLAACGVRDLSSDLQDYMYFFPISPRSRHEAAVPHVALLMALLVAALGSVAAAFHFAAARARGARDAIVTVALICMAALVVVMLAEMHVNRREVMKRHDYDRKVANGLALDALSRQLTARIEAGDAEEAAKIARRLVATFNACNAVTATQPAPPFPVEAIAINTLMAVALGVLAAYVLRSFKPLDLARQIHKQSAASGGGYDIEATPGDGEDANTRWVVSASLALVVFGFYAMRFMINEGDSMAALTSSLEGMTACA